MTEQLGTASYFPHAIQISARYWRNLDLGPFSLLIADRGIPSIIFYRQLALKLNRERGAGAVPVHAGQLNLFATLQTIFRYLIDVLAEEQSPGVILEAVRRSGLSPADEAVQQTMECFVDLFPPRDVLTGAADTTGWFNRGNTAANRTHMVLRELLLLSLAAENPAIDSFREILDDGELASAGASYSSLVTGITRSLAGGPLLNRLNMTLTEALRAPVKASPDSLSGQVGFIRDRWHALLPSQLLEELTTAFDILLEEEREWGWGGEPGPPPVLEFGRDHRTGGADRSGEDGSSVFGGYDYPEYEHFSADADWMSNVVLMAKMVYVWLDQLAKQYGYPITRLDQVPDAELDRLATAGFTGLWLIGVWERSPASQRIKQLCGNPDAIASAYSLYDYEVAEDLGGWKALGNLRERALLRGIRMASDMVPNHTGIYSRWVIQHPDWFVQTDYPPFPTYQFNGEDLSHSGDAVIQIEDGYWTKTDAAVVFRYIDRHTGRTRYIYHGNDGTSIPWNDTAQLNYLIPEVREAVIQTILHVARNFPIIRFDAAMTLAKKHYQRLWFPVRGLGGGIPSRAGHGMSREEFDAVFPVEFWREVVDRVAVEAPGTLLLAEAFWLMEGYFVRTLGMHRVYNSAFMNMLKQEENAKYRQTIRNVLEFNPEVLKRFVNFMNNPDEKTAVAQFGTQGKYFGACVLLATMPGLPMFGHGQIEGLHEKYGMEYKRAYWDETVDSGLVRGHEMWIFPLLRRRWLFSGSENFALYDFHAGNEVNENVFAYSNSLGDQHALVLYHNSYASTAGWINGSVSFAVKGDNGETQLQRTSIAKALGLSADDNIYYAFRDITNGFEFLRNGKELCSRGLYAELGEYEFHVFMDFREIRDDADGTWGAFCASLNGRGVENLGDERLQIRFASLNASFRGVLELVPASSSCILADLVAAEPRLASAKQRFHTILIAQNTQGAAKPAVKPADFLQSLSCLATLQSLKPSAGIAKACHARLLALLDSASGGRLLVAWMLLRDTPPGTLETYGLDCSMRRLLTFEETPDERVIAARSVRLLQALLEFRNTAADPMMESSSLIDKLFMLSACREFLLIHESGGVEWFNKERFEELVQWLFIIRLTELSAKKLTTRAWSTWLRSTGLEIQHFHDLAAHAGYRTSLFLHLLLADVKKAVVTGQGTVTKKNTRTKADAQSGVRALSTGTPDNKIPR